jgi:2-dehydro-3-deoxyphosphogluconate aldolase/(4S)-4-hydroxy-2-oxoglutarate aldolase
VPYLPGVMTPTEIAIAWTAGAAAVKIFPAATLGPRYIASVREPLPAPLLLPSGGVRIDDVAEYLRVGAVAVCLGGDLLGDALHGGSLPGLRERARRVGEQVSQHRDMAGLK